MSFHKKLALVLSERGVFWPDIAMGAMKERARAIRSVPPDSHIRDLPFAGFVNIDAV